IRCYVVLSPHQGTAHHCIPSDVLRLAGGAYGGSVEYTADGDENPAGSGSRTGKPERSLTLQYPDCAITVAQSVDCADIRPEQATMKFVQLTLLWPIEGFMHLPNKQSDTITDLAVKLRGLTEILLAPLSPTGEPVKEERSTDLFVGRPSRVLLYIAEGEVEYRVHGKVITYFEQGDLIGLPRSLALPDGQFTCTAPVVLVPYDRDALVDQVNGDPQLQKHWAYYLLCQLSFYQQALAQEIREEFQPAAGFLYYRAGETIIQQGTLADKVYTLL